MAFALGAAQKSFVDRMVRSGKYNNQSEVVREALRRMEKSETDYLNPPPLTPSQIEAIYGRDDTEERKSADALYASFKKAARKCKPQ